MSENPRILILRRRGLGDLLVSMDLLRPLREHWPGCFVGVVVDRPFASVLDGQEGVDLLHVYDAARMRRLSAANKLAESWRWMRELREGRYDIVLDLMGTPQTAVWTRRSGAPLRVGIERRWRSWAYNRLLRREGGEGRYAGERVLDFARALELDPGAWQPFTIRPAALSPALAQLVEDARPPRVGLNPSATWEAKAWPAAHWAALARALADRLPARPLLIWGPGDEAMRDAIVRLAPEAVSVPPATSLGELSGILGGLDLLVTTDSGPKHLAVSTGTPTLTLFGSTDPRGWQPPLAEHDALHDTQLPCRPCDLLDCPLDGHPCMEDLSPERVLDALQRRLTAEPSHG